MGCDNSLGRLGFGVDYFNPRTPVGCDSNPRPAISARRYFNPRTPVGCDWEPQPAVSVTEYFNPRTPVGCDGMRPVTCRCSTDFNPRTPVGCDSWPPTGPPCCHDFNPRTPVGCDLRLRRLRLMAYRFQSTHPSGVRRADRQGRGHPQGISIHAPQWGATWKIREYVLPNEYFNPRTPVGCDLLL